MLVLFEEYAPYLAAPVGAIILINLTKKVIRKRRNEKYRLRELEELGFCKLIKTSNGIKKVIKVSKKRNSLTLKVYNARISVDSVQEIKRTLEDIYGKEISDVSLKNTFFGQNHIVITFESFPDNYLLSDERGMLDKYEMIIGRNGKNERRILNILNGDASLAIFGTSGCGKSNLVYCIVDSFMSSRMKKKLQIMNY